MSLRVPYDYKVIRYPNGTIKVQHYDKPLTRCMSDKMLGYEDEPYGIYYNVAINPFTGNVGHFVDTLSDKKSSDNIDDNKRRSLNRTKQAVYTYSRCADWQYFVTLTFDPAKIDRYDFDICSKALRKWLNNQRRVSVDLQYLFVPEYHLDGAIHFHGLIASVGNISFVDSGKRDKMRRVIYNMSGWRFGFSTATKVSNLNRASTYICKYVNKSLCDLVSGRQRYYVSQNIDKPIIDRYYMGDWDSVDFVDFICDKYKKNVVHVSKTRTAEAFVNVTYYDLQ